MKSTLLDNSIRILLLILLSFTLLYYGKPFLVPFLIASLLAMLVLPLCARLERRMHKALAILISMSVLLVVVCIIVSVFTWQVSDIADKAPRIQQNISQKVKQLKEFATNTLGIPEQQQEQIMQQQQQSSTGRLRPCLRAFLLLSAASWLILSL